MKRPAGLLTIVHAESVMVCAPTTSDAIRSGKPQALMPGLNGVEPDIYLVYPLNRHMPAHDSAFVHFVRQTVVEFPAL